MVAPKPRGRPSKEGVRRTKSGRISKATGSGRWPADRPPKLAEQVGVKLSSADHARVVELATAADVSPAEWIRGVVEERLRHADHARQVAAHLEAVGGMPSATD